MAGIFTGTNGDNDDWLITPTLNIQPNQRLRFSYKVYNDSFEEDLKIKLSTSGTALSAFNTILYETSYSTTTAASGTTEGSNTLEVASSTGIRIGDVFYITNFPFPYGRCSKAANATAIQCSIHACLALSDCPCVPVKYCKMRKLVMGCKSAAISNANVRT